MSNGNYTAEYLRKRTIVRRWFWTPITLAIFTWLGVLYGQWLVS